MPESEYNELDPQIVTTCKRKGALKGRRSSNGRQKYGNAEGIGTGTSAPPRSPPMFSRQQSEGEGPRSPISLRSRRQSDGRRSPISLRSRQQSEVRDECSSPVAPPGFENVIVNGNLQLGESSSNNTLTGSSEAQLEAQVEMVVGKYGTALMEAPVIGITVVEGSKYSWRKVKEVEELSEGGENETAGNENVNSNGESQVGERSRKHRKTKTSVVLSEEYEQTWRPKATNKDKLFELMSKCKGDPIIIDVDGNFATLSCCRSLSQARGRLDDNYVRVAACLYVKVWGRRFGTRSRRLCWDPTFAIRVLQVEGDNWDSVDRIIQSSIKNTPVASCLRISVTVIGGVPPSR
ncbi:uncharacterized protein LOC130590534 [Beta vulgaris subsp. vulgaris]|uniref:uncharacterized protein LOC130590534 n=1 Tax=Beta vulgaris subsp. vulgaris TaxID=3555 RepID=UPI0025494374|nr:uncharacterized protein LOC130590534 [Beta vulgaris subsp. vulgaris]